MWHQHVGKFVKLWSPNYSVQIPKENDFQVICLFKKYSVQCSKDVTTCNTLESICSSINGVGEDGRLLLLSSLPCNLRSSNKTVFSAQPPHMHWAIQGRGPGARFSKVPVTLRARNQIFKSKYKE